MNINNLANTITSNGIDCIISGLMLNDDGLASKASQVNSKLRSLLGKDIDFNEHDDIEKGHLNGSRLHLNRWGTGRLAFNFIQYIENLRDKKQLQYIRVFFRTHE